MFRRPALAPALVAACFAFLAFAPGAQAGVTECQSGVHDVTIEFDPAVYTVEEDAGTVRLTVVRVDGKDAELDCRAVFNFATINGQATGGQDFVHRAEETFIEFGEWATNFTVQILNSGAAEPTEKFEVDITASSGTVAIGNNGTAEVFIEDDDSSGATTVTQTITETVTSGTATVTTTTTQTVTETTTATATVTNGTTTGEQEQPGPALGFVAMALAAVAMASRRR